MSITMSMKLLPASVDGFDPSQPFDVSNSLAHVTQGAITTGAGQIAVVPSADAFTWSSSTRQSGANWIDATPVEDSDTDATEGSDWEFVPGWAWSSPVQRTVVALYLAYATGSAGWIGRLINLYA